MDTDTFHNIVRDEKPIYGDCKKVYKKLDGSWLEVNADILKKDNGKKYYGTHIDVNHDGVPFDTSGDNGDIYIHLTDRIEFSIDSFGMFRIILLYFSGTPVKTINIRNKSQVKTHTYTPANTKIHEVYIILDGIELTIRNQDTIDIYYRNEGPSKTVKRLGSQKD